MPGLWSYCSLGVKKVIKRLHNSCRLYVLFLFCFPGIRGTFRAKSESLGGALRCCCFSHGQLKPCARNPSETAFNARKPQVNKEISNELCRPFCYSSIFLWLLYRGRKNPPIRPSKFNKGYLWFKILRVEINDQNTDYLKHKFS